jgi:hypothetical protein
MAIGKKQIIQAVVGLLIIVVMLGCYMAIVYLGESN